MNQRVLAFALAGVFACGPAWADSFRLAFSKAENIEIFVEHAAGAPWCSAKPDLRVVYHGAPDPAALERLLPKLGALLGQQCPQAEAVTWRSQDGAGKAVAQGSGSKAGQWRPGAATAPAAPASVAAAPPVAAPAPAPAPASAAAPVPAAQVPAAPASAPVPAAGQADVPSGSSAVAEKGAAEQAAVQAPAARYASLGAAGFEVGGWKPESEADVLAKSPFIRELSDQNGCKIRIGYRLDDEDAKYASLLSSGLSCDAAGRAQGVGGLTLQRSDGAVISRERKVYFLDGYAFNTPVQSARLAGTNGRDAVWFSLGHDAEDQSYFLLRATVLAWGSGLLPLRVQPELDVLTAQESGFRQAADISRQVDAALHALQTVALPDATGASVRFADSLEGVVSQDRERMMYAIHANRDWNYRQRQAVGSWKYRLDQGTNYVFAREKRRADEERERKRREAFQEQQRQQQLAWEKRRELETRAREAENQLRQYENLVSEARQGPAGVLKRHFVRSDRYVPLQGGAYARLYGGGAVPFRQIVHIDGRDGDEAKADFPYDLRIAGGKDVKEAWYVVRGQARVDETRLDEDGLALTVVTPDPEGGLRACKEKGCADLAEPLTVMRLLSGQPDWTPEAAQASIDQAKAR